MTVIDFKELYRTHRQNYPDAPAQFEAVLEALYTEILQPGDIAVDCGAHTGKHTIPMALKVGPAGRIYAFEPIKEKLDLLREKAHAANVADIIQLRNAAIGADAGTVSFNYVESDPGKSSIHLRQDILSDAAKMATTTVRVVELCTLDGVMESESSCAFIKIDVEGAELSVLQGAEKVIASCRPVIHFEMGEVSLKEFGVKPIQISDFLRKRGYRIFDILGNNLDVEDDYINSAKAGGVYDYIATPPGFDSPSAIAQAAAGVFR